MRRISATGSGCSQTLMNAVILSGRRERPGRGSATTTAADCARPFRASEQLATPALGSPAGLVDATTVERLWAALERAGKAQAVRTQLLDLTAVRR